MPMAEPIPDLSAVSLEDIARMVAEARLPPVEQWQPLHSGEIDIRIAADGRWFHQGGEINRPSMVRLFSSILRREPNGRYVLVTPHEKLAITVEDAPFLAVEAKSSGAGEARTLAFRLNSGDLVVAGPGHRLRIEGSVDAPRPYLEVRGGMLARLTRPVFYELAQLAAEERPDTPGLWSGGEFFPMMP